jgi:excisionase family DNA binding protein
MTTWALSSHTTRHTLTVPEVAALFGVAPWTVFAHVRAGDFAVPATRVGRKVLFATAAVERALELEPGALSGVEGVSPATAEVGR